ncbi:MAG: hypothetical protein WBX16_16150 [Candidatus Acidiferrales bacterium]
MEDHERLHCVSVQRNMHGLSIFRSRDSGDSRSKVYVFPHETLVLAAASQSGIQSESELRLMLAPRRVRPYRFAKSFFFVGRKKPDTQVIFRLAPNPAHGVFLDLAVTNAKPEC